MSDSPALLVTVSTPVPKSDESQRTPPVHHHNGYFINPWPSFRYLTFTSYWGYLINLTTCRIDLLQTVWVPFGKQLNSSCCAVRARLKMSKLNLDSKRPPGAKMKARTRSRPPGSGELLSCFLSNKERNEEILSSKLKFLSLKSHACFLVELPAPRGAVRGPRILFDPVFSHRCSPSQLVGPARYTSENNNNLFFCLINGLLINDRDPMQDWRHSQYWCCCHICTHSCIEPLSRINIVSHSLA